MEQWFEVIVTINRFSPSTDKEVLDLMPKPLGRLDNRHVRQCHLKPFFTAMVQRSLTGPCDGPYNPFGLQVVNCITVANTFLVLMGLLAKGVLVVATVAFFQITNLLLVRFYLCTQFPHKLLIALAAGIHAVKSLPQRVNHVKKIPDGGLKAQYLVDVILAFHIRQQLFGVK